jgi:hypothetical protein
MKIIAVLRMLFLPGTFIAVSTSWTTIRRALPTGFCYAIGHFFNASLWLECHRRCSCYNAGFKYYWAITIPLTLLVLVSLAITTSLPWSKWLSSRHHRQVEGS